MAFQLRLAPAVLIVAAGLLSGALYAEPAFSLARPAGPIPVVYPDTRNSHVFYYPPGSLRVADDPQGGPDLRFLQMIYMGTEATGDPGRFLARSVLSFRVIMEAPTPADLRAAKAALPAGTVLQPTPIRRMESSLVWTPLAADPTTDPAPAPVKESSVNGRLEDSERANAAATAYWTERVFTLNPDPLSSQALWEALHKGQVILSLTYSFFSEGDTQGVTEITSTGGALPPAVAELAKKTGESKQVFPVRSDAFAILADAKRFPDRFIRIDINQSVPPGYAALDIRCYDFDNALRPDLARKSVEIRATGVNGRPVTRSVMFRASAPEVASAGLKFPVAVRLDQPFSFRIIEIFTDGRQKVSAWKSNEKWYELLDVTTPPDQRPKSPDTDDPQKSEVD
jgi:hypothetical protein